jgi:hypothetical protein
MPNVGGVEYPYTPEGVAAAQQHFRQIQKTGPYIPQPTVGLDPARMSPPMTSPSHPMAQRQVSDLQPYTGFDQIQQQIAGYGQPPRYVDYGVGSASAPWAVGPAPRGNVVETYGSGNYGSSPSNPNWGQDTGGRSIQKSGPLPVSTRTQAINPQDRINANIRAVMSGQQGPSPGTSPTGQAPARPPRSWQNQFGPTGQPMAQRVPAQKMVDNVVRQLPGG